MKPEVMSKLIDAQEKRNVVKMDWLTLEEHIRAILESKEYESDSQKLDHIGFVIGAWTGRGYPRIP